MSDSDKRVTVRLEELALANSLTLTALVGLLEEKGVLTQAEVAGADTQDSGPATKGGYN